MHRRHRSLSAPWLLALGATAGVWALAASPSWLSPGAGLAVRDGFSILCHQLADRSPHLHGAQWGLCFRCTGMVGGVALGLASGPFVSSWFARAADAWGGGRLLLAFGVPMFVDWLLGATGLWANTPVSRLATGAVFGMAAGWLLAEALLRPSSPVSLTQPTS